jgi:hypothetical protein
MKKILAVFLLLFAPSFSFCVIIEPAISCGMQFSSPIEDYGIMISDGSNIFSLEGYRNYEAAAGFKVGWSESTISPSMGGGLFFDFSDDLLCSLRCSYIPSFSYSAEFDDTFNHITFLQKASVGLFTAAPGLTLRYTVNDSLAFFVRAEFPGVAVQNISFSYKEVLSNGDVIHDSTDSESEYEYYYSAGIGVRYCFGPMFNLSAEAGYSSAARSVGLTIDAAFNPGGYVKKEPFAGKAGQSYAGMVK